MSEPELYRILCAYFAEWYPGVIPERIVITDTTGKKYAMTIPLAVRPGFAKPEVKKVYTTSEPVSEDEKVEAAIITALMDAGERLTCGVLFPKLKEANPNEQGFSERNLQRVVARLVKAGEITNFPKDPGDGLGRGYGMP